MIKVSKQAAASLIEIQNGLDGIAASLAKLEAQLRAVEKQWDGEAREAFVVAEARWRGQLEVLKALASSARQFSQNHVDDVHAFDTRRAGAWKR